MEKISCSTANENILNLVYKMLKTDAKIALISFAEDENLSSLLYELKSLVKGIWMLDRVAQLKGATLVF